MEKSWRLQRYHRKDYSELVEFPVEIVGRDGVVRRYTFEDSIRLYRRRITFAPIRYRDGELIGAEVEHCRARIDQLRRSYFYRYGWGTPEGQPAPVEVFGTIAGELAAFICRVLRVEGRPEVRFEPVADPVDLAPGEKPSTEGSRSEAAAIGAEGSASGDVTTWYVVPRGSTSGMLLYVHRFEGPDADHVRERFFAMLKSLERMGRAEGDGERLIAFHHTVDCGFVLTGRGGEFEALAALQQEEDEPAAGEPTPWDDALETMRRGDYADALVRCRQIVTEQPWHRNAYVAGAVLAQHLEQPLAAEDFALVGTRYFPQDATLHYYVGLARARQHRTEEAVVALEQALALSPGSSQARLLLAVLLVTRRRYSSALTALRGRIAARADDRRSDAAMERLERWIFWRWLMVTTGYASASLGLVATGLAGWFGLFPVSLGLGFAACGLYLFRRELARMATWQRFEDLGHGLRRIRRRPPESLVS